MVVTSAASFCYYFVLRVWLSQGGAMLPSQDKPRVDWGSLGNVGIQDRHLNDFGSPPPQLILTSARTVQSSRAALFHGDCAGGPSSAVTAV